MKKVYIILLALILLSLAFFTFYGEELYYIGKPVVSTGSVSSSSTGQLSVPAGALRKNKMGAFVYLIKQEEGYSRTIYTVTRREIAVLGISGDAAQISPLSELTMGNRVVVGSSETLDEGVRVVMD